jgi:hypothetical protein
MPTIGQLDKGQLNSVSSFAMRLRDEASKAAIELGHSISQIKLVIKDRATDHSFIQGSLLLEKRWAKAKSDFTSAFRMPNLERLVERYKTLCEKYKDNKELENYINKSVKTIQEWEKSLKQELETEEAANEPENWAKVSKGQRTGTLGKIENLSSVNFAKAAKDDTELTDLAEDYYERQLKLLILIEEKFQSVVNFYKALIEILDKRLKQPQQDVLQNYPLLKKFDLDDMFAALQTVSADKENLARTLSASRKFETALKSFLDDPKSSFKLDSIDIRDLTQHIDAQEEKNSNLNFLNLIFTPGHDLPISIEQEAGNILPEAAVLLKKISALKQQYITEKNKTFSSIVLIIDAKQSTKNPTNIKFLENMQKTYEGFVKQNNLILSIFDHFTNLVEGNSEHSSLGLVLLHRLMCQHHLNKEWQKFTAFLEKSQHNGVRTNLDKFLEDLSKKSLKETLKLEPKLFFEKEGAIKAQPELTEFLRKQTANTKKLDALNDSLEKRQASSHVKHLSMLTLGTSTEPSTPLTPHLSICSMTGEQFSSFLPTTSSSSHKPSATPTAFDERSFSVFLQSFDPNSAANSPTEKPLPALPAPTGSGKAVKPPTTKFNTFSHSTAPPVRHSPVPGTGTGTVKKPSTSTKPSLNAVFGPSSGRPNPTPPQFGNNPTNNGSN